MIDGRPAPKGPKRRQLLLRRDDGAEIIAQLRQSNFVDPVPQVIIDGQTITLAEPLKWYHWFRSNDKAHKAHNLIMHNLLQTEAKGM